METAYRLSIPRTVEEACDPHRIALLVYDMQIGVVSQISDGPEIVSRVASLVDAARAAGIRIVYTRHMFLPTAMAGVSALRTAMAWQRVSTVAQVRPFLLRDSAGFELVRELAPTSDELVLDKISMSAFLGTPLDIVLRDCGIDTFVVAGVAMEVGIEPTVRHSLDLGYLPVIVTDACGAGDRGAADRSLATLAFAGGSLQTTTAALTGLLRAASTESQAARHLRHRPAPGEETLMKIAVIGAGSVGSTLGSAWRRLGHDVVYGVPQPDAGKYGSLDAPVTTNRRATQEADVVALCTPWQATRQAIADCGNLSGKVLVDCTNPLTPDTASLAVGHTTSGAEQVAGWAPGARVCKAMNQIGAPMMDKPKLSQMPVMFICGDDAAAKDVVGGLVTELGFEVVDAGDLSLARLLEPYALIWIHLAFRRGFGTDFGFAVLRAA